MALNNVCSIEKYENLMFNFSGESTADKLAALVIQDIEFGIVSALLLTVALSIILFNM